MKARTFAAASGAGSLTTTATPRLRNCAAQDAPIVPAPMTATRRGRTA